MKRLLVILLSLILAFCFISCAEEIVIPEEPVKPEEPVHVHTWKEEEIKATCTTNGKKVRTCTGCGAVEEEVIKYDNVSHVFVDGVCSVCEASEETVKNAEARVGHSYFEKFADAVYSAMKMEEKEKRVVEVLKEEISLNSAHYPCINGSIVINANGADFNNMDFSIYTHEAKDSENNIIPAETSGEVNIVINDAKNLYIWGEIDGFTTEDTILNITLNSCKNIGADRDKQKGRMIYLTGTKGTLNINLNSCTVEKVDSPVYKNASGELNIKDSVFNDCAVPININHKASAGTMSVVIDSCTFDSCGTDVDPIKEYAAPIRVVHTVDGSETKVLIKNSSVKNTVSSKGDVLLVDDRDGNIILPLSSVFEGNKTDLQVLAEKGDDLITVPKNESKTLEAGTRPNEG